MYSKTALSVGGTLLFLYGVFGYLFPEWGNTIFHNNENLLHVVTGILAVVYAHAGTRKRSITLFLLTLTYLVLGLYGFTLKNPHVQAPVRTIAHLTDVDNYIHIVFALFFAYGWIVTRSRKA